jgi:hypothetical protein
MMKISRVDSASPFNLEILTELYQKMTFPQRSQIFELFLPQSAQLPATNPPLSFFHVFDQRKPDYLIPMRLVELLLGSVGR